MYAAEAAADRASRTREVERYPGLGSADPRGPEMVVVEPTPTPEAMIAASNYAIADALKEIAAALRERGNNEHNA